MGERENVVKGLLEKFGPERTFEVAREREQRSMFMN